MLLYIGIVHVSIINLRSVKVLSVHITVLLPTQAKTSLPLLLLTDVSHEPAQVKTIGESIL